MFHLFRRHQKVLLTSIAAIAIGSMAFSAIAPLFFDQNQTKSAMKEDLVKDLDTALVRLFEHSFDASSSQVIYPEPVFTSALIETGLLKATLTLNKEVVASELEAVFEKIANYTPHEIQPGATSWDLIAQVSPKLHGILKELKQAKSLAAEKKLELLESFYKEKNKLPLPLLQQYVYASSKGQTKLELDDLYYFGLDKPEEFFGKTLVNKSTAALSQSLKQDAQKHSSTAVLQNFSAKLDRFYGSHIHPNQFFIAMGLSPECGLEALKILESIKTLKADIASSLLLDPVSYKTFEEYASKQIAVTKYIFKPDYEPKSLEQAALLEMYSSLKEPLYADEYQIKVRSIEKSKAFKKLPKKELYKEALSQYVKLSEMMPYALSKGLESEKDRLEAIKNLSGSSKDILESHVHKIMLQNDPKFFQKALLEEKTESKTLYFSSLVKKAPLAGFANLEVLKKELDIMPLNTPVMFDLDASYLYEIELLSKSSSKEPLNYFTALSSGILKEKLVVDLDLVYKDQIRKNPTKFLNASKKLKSFDEAYQDLLEISMSDLKTKLASTLNVSSETIGSFLLKGYPKYILSKYRASDDFRIASIQDSLALYEEDDKSVKSLFSAKIGSFSDVIKDRQGQHVMYKKVSEPTSGEPFMDKRALEVLASEKLKAVFFEKVKSL